MSSVILDITVTPGASKQRLVRSAQGMLKCYVTSQPEKNKANKELVSFIAQTLGISSGSVRIISGETARKKRIEIVSNLTKEEVVEKLFGCEQLPLFKDS